MGSKWLGGFKVESVFYPSEVYQMSTRNSWELEVKKKLSTQMVIATLKQVKPIQKKGS